MLLNRPHSATRIDTRLEHFLAKQLGLQNVEFYDQESCVEELKKINVFKKYPFRILIVCQDRIFICDNPPKNLDNFICFEDILDIKAIDDVPKFLDGSNKENALHIRIDYVYNSKKKNELIELKKKIIELKKSMLYSKTIDDKISEMELYTPRSFKDDLISTYRSFSTDFDLANGNSNKYEYSKRDDLLFTNRTNKSVHFEDDNEKNIMINKHTLNPSKEINNKKLDDLTNKATNERYKKLLEFVKNSENTSDSSSQFTLSLPLTPRSVDMVSAAASSDLPYLSKETSKSMENLNDKLNLEFIKDAEKNESVLHLYILNPKTRIFETLKLARFYSKIRSTLNYHSNLTNNTEIVKEDSKSTILRKIKKNNEIEKKFCQLKNEIISNIDDLDMTLKLFDELLCATSSYFLLKKCFWNTSELFRLTVNQIMRYLPKSPANMKSNKAAARRLKELECCITFIELLSVMLSETEFYTHRNETLAHEKCKNLASLIPLLVCDPELAILTNVEDDEENYEFHKKMQNLLADFSLVSAILLWEILHFLNLNLWKNDYFTFDICIRTIENSKSIELFLRRLIGELSKLITYNNYILLSAQQTIVIYKIITLFKSIIEKSSSKILINILRQNYQEEFKYYFSEEKIKSKCFNYYPIVNDLLVAAKKLEEYILE